ncbi:MAG: glycosyltransferase [Devosia sp.]|nr:glycosyltransferase [Devosia sp.]
MGTACASSAEARAILDAALALEVDPIDYCARRTGLGERLVLKRAATWAGIGYSETIPGGVASAAEGARTDHLTGCRAVAIRHGGRERHFITPSFAQVLEIEARRTHRPELSLTHCFVHHSVLRAALARTYEASLLRQSRQRVAVLWPGANASVAMGLGARLAFVIISFAMIAFLSLAPTGLAPVTLSVAVLLLGLPSLMRLVAAFMPAAPSRSGGFRYDIADLPTYSVLIPLHDEALMVEQLYRAMSELEYPPEKIEVIFVVEARSSATLSEAHRVSALDDRFDVVAVPHGLPLTKPKALDFALPLVSGEILVIYDAEDIPDADQLRRAAERFIADPALDCLQAELVPENASENWLTIMFAGEYAGLFGNLLPAFARWGLPMPLGGTSNHFRASTLRRIGGWDAFNVTEDADLGLRLARLGCRTATIASQTGEEAPVHLRAWMTQRTRWMKGWMQTFLAHNRHPIQLAVHLGWRSFIIYELFLAAMIFSPILHTGFAAVLIWRLGSGQVISDGTATSAVFWAIFLIGYGGAMGLTMVGLWRLKKFWLIPVQLTLPAYWVLHAVATMLAALQLITRPTYWAKTAHGLTRVTRLTVLPSSPVVARAVEKPKPEDNMA